MEYLSRIFDAFQKTGEPTGCPWFDRCVEFAVLNAYIYFFKFRRGVESLRNQSATSRKREF